MHYNMNMHACLMMNMMVMNIQWYVRYDEMVDACFVEMIYGMLVALLNLNITMYACYLERVLMPCEWEMLWYGLRCKIWYAMFRWMLGCMLRWMHKVHGVELDCVCVCVCACACV